MTCCNHYCNGPAAGTDDSTRLIEKSVKGWTTAKNRRRLPTRSRETVQLQSESQGHVVIDTGVQTEGARRDGGSSLSERSG